VPAQRHGPLICRSVAGCRSGSIETEAISFSSNIRRDAVAAHLNINCLHHIQRYWMAQLALGVRSKKGGYVNTYPSDEAMFSSRGVSVFSYYLASVRLVLESSGTCRLRPLYRDMDVPLLPLANWDEGIVPWLQARLDGEPKVIGLDGGTTVYIEGM